MKKESIKEIFDLSRSSTLNNKRYTVLTHIFGNYEPVREVEEKDPEAEYILVTDNKDIASNTWNVVYDDIEGVNAFDKVCNIRVNAFKYCNTNICIRLDASMKIKRSLKTLIDKFEEGNYDISFIPHPSRYNFKDEYDSWVKIRNYSSEHANECLNYFKNSGYDLNYKGLYQTGLTITRRNSICESIKQETFSLAKSLGENGCVERIDQIVFSYIMNTKFSQLKVLPLSEQILNSWYIQFYRHGSNEINANKIFDLRKPDFKYLFNTKTECYYLLTPQNNYIEREEELLNNLKIAQEKNFILAGELTRISEENANIKNSNSFKLGHKLLVVPGYIKRKIKKLV